MLVLGRKAGESLLIGGVEVVIVRINGNRVSLGVDAPKEVKILRKELTENDGKRNGGNGVGSQSGMVASDCGGSGNEGGCANSG